jgi:hypothetical protein
MSRKSIVDTSKQHILGSITLTPAQECYAQKKGKRTVKTMRAHTLKQKGHKKLWANYHMRFNM